MIQLDPGISSSDHKRRSPAGSRTSAKGSNRLKPFGPADFAGSSEAIRGAFSAALRNLARAAQPGGAEERELAEEKPPAKKRQVPVDFRVMASRPGWICVQSFVLFDPATGDQASRLVACLMQWSALREVRVLWGTCEAHLYFDSRKHSPHDALQEIAGTLRSLGSWEEQESREAPEDVHLLRIDSHCSIWGRRKATPESWKIVHSIPGRLRVRSRLLKGNRHLAQAIDRELLSIWGIDTFHASPLTGSVLVAYDPRRIAEKQIVEILIAIAKKRRLSVLPDRIDHDFPVNCACVPLALGAELALAPISPAIGLLVLVANLPTLRSAWAVSFREKRLGCDLLDTIVVAGCLATGHLFAASVIGWCLSLGRLLLRKTREDSQKLIQGAFSKQPYTAWLWKDGQEIEVPLNQISPGCQIVVHAGESIPVDGLVAEGMGLIDQHSLTGESTPAEKGVGEEVFAMTILMSGRLRVEVTRSGNETTSAKIGQILQNTASFKLASQSRGERLSDQAVPPTLAIGAVGMASLGVDGGVAVLNSECGTGIRLAAPLGMLSSLTLCATNGILVKDGRALENLNKVDTVLFDKTGTLTKEQPEVDRIHALPGFDANELLCLAAIAEQRFTHPIARAIIAAAKERELPLHKVEGGDYRLGFGIEVRIDGKVVRVGSPRYLTSEGLQMPQRMGDAICEAGTAGHTMVVVGIDREVAGGIELRASSRPEAESSIQALRKLGIRHTAVISGDREEPTRRLAESLGLDRYFAEVLPQDKAAYVEKLQKEGARVCFVGDGVNDAIALKKADVSISLRGASAIATDTAQVILLEDNLAKICELVGIARDLERNIRRSWHMILAPNLLCVFGVFALGFGVFHSVLTNNVAALGAVANGMLPLRRAARLRSKKDLAAEELLLYAKAHQYVSADAIRSGR